MSISASIDIVLQPKTKTLSDLFSVLLAAGWSESDHGQLTCMDTGDEFDWSEKNIDDLNLVLNRLTGILAKEQPIGIVLTWPKELIGGMFVISPKERMLSVICSIYRKTLDSSPRWTDYSWYLERLIVPLEKSGYQIESITCQDY